VNVGAHRSVVENLVGDRGVIVASRGDVSEGLLRRVSIALVLGVAVLLACALQGALYAGVARADVPGLVSNGNFASEGGLGVAVDQSSGDVFVTSFFSGSNEKFEASGKLLSPPSPFGGEGNYGAAVNPTNGDLYVASPLSNEIDTYDPNTGAPISSFPVPEFWAGTSLEELVDNIAQLATDSAGDVYVPIARDNEVLEYGPSPSCGGEPVECLPLKKFTGSGTHALSAPTGVAVDASGNVWVADDGSNRIEEFGPTGAFIGEFKSEGVRAIALYEHKGTVDVFAVVNNGADFCGSFEPPCTHLVEYTPGGAQLADVGAGDFGASRKDLGVFSMLAMVAVDESSGRVYVTDSSKHLVWVYQPPVAPVLGKELAAEVGTSEAKLGALVNPGGVETTYRFEYLTEAAFQLDKESFSGPERPSSVPFPEGSVGQGLSARTVWASAGGLAPDTTYHYRVIVTSGLGADVGADQTFTTETAAQASCPNEQLRGGFSAALPDCRAYELVTTPTTTSAQPDTQHITGDFLAGGGVQGSVAARDGNRMSYESAEVLPGSQSAGLAYVATRGTGGWSSQDVIPLQPYTGDRCPSYEQSKVAYSSAMNEEGYSTDLSKTVVSDGGLGFIGNCRGEAVEVVSGEPLGAENLLLRDNTSGAYQLIDVTPPGVIPTNAIFVAASADLGRVVFRERTKLVADALDNVENLYEWSGGVVRLLTVLPDGTPVEGSFVSISPEGSDVFFSVGRDLYVRLNGERTVQVDETHGGSGLGGGGSFAAVSAGGSQVFFIDEASAGLTNDTVSGSGENLYRYDVQTGQLSDLTPLGDAKAALAGISEDGSYVYYYAETALPGSQSNQLDETAQDGKPNLYVEHEGTIAFITHERVGAGQISPNGAYFAFNSDKSLTGYDNNGVNGVVPEIYLYSAASNRFACASCNPSGEPPTLAGEVAGGGGGGVRGGGGFLGGVPHYVSNNGQVFFQTGEALLPSDTNGQNDVYEYEDGGLHLVSTGTGSTESTLLDTSESGDDVFFLTRQKLLPQDTNEEALSIYDARVDGGFPETAMPPPCTTADACRSAPAPQPSIFGEPASQTFSGIGNLAPAEVKAKAKPKAKPVKCKKGSVKRKGKCVKKAKKSGKNAKKSAHANKRTGK
jgi:hypothetical protein